MKEYSECFASIKHDLANCNIWIEVTYGEYEIVFTQSKKNAALGVIFQTVFFSVWALLGLYILFDFLSFSPIWSLTVALVTIASILYATAKHQSPRHQRIYFRCDMKANKIIAYDINQVNIISSETKLDDIQDFCVCHTLEGDDCYSTLCLRDNHDNSNQLVRNIASSDYMDKLARNLGVLCDRTVWRREQDNKVALHSKI